MKSLSNNINSEYKLLQLINPKSQISRLGQKVKASITIYKIKYIQSKEKLKDFDYQIFPTNVAYMCATELEQPRPNPNVNIENISIKQYK